VEGTIPRGLRGTIFRNGPGNFERGGNRFEHVLDGDGLLCRFSLDGETGRASFASRFVRTPEFEAERAADAILYRNTFGTQPAGMLSNLGNLVLKNPANTNVQVWGGKTLALWEAALPCRVNPATLQYEGVEDFDGLCLAGGMTVTTGFPAADKLLGLGTAFTAHPREDRSRGRMVGFSWAAPLLPGSEMQVQLAEWDRSTGALLDTLDASLPTMIAPHDFAVTDNYYIFALNACELRLAPYLLGFCGPVGALRTTGRGVTLKLIPRPGGTRAGSAPITVETDDPYFAIHHATAFELPPSDSGGDSGGSIRLYTAAWPRVGVGPFLGDWGGAVPLYDGGQIQPTVLMESTIELSSELTTASVAKTTLAGSACIDHPSVDPRFDGRPGCRYVFMSFCNDGEPSGSPPVGWSRLDLQTGEMHTWRSSIADTFCEELVVIPRPSDNAEAPATDEADVWLAGMMFDAQRGVSCLAILDGDHIEAGPVCQLWLSNAIPHGLHGCFAEDVYGLD